jgi:hypothetical protein
MALQNGDLSSHVAPKLLLVYEGALGFCTDTKKYDKAASRHQWEKAWQHWELNELMVRQILWLFHKKDVRTEVVTFLHRDFATELRHQLDEMDLPVHRVWSTTPESLGRQIAYMPDLACVYDPEPERWLMYGGKGRLITSALQLGEDVGYGLAL